MDVRRVVDISKHELVPKHEVMSEEEAKELLERLNITKGQLPKILKSDPMVQKIKAKPGDIIKITRKSPTAGTTIYYRVVVNE
ncbi:MAG: DNA-directed RNA polymerase subunit H [Euryarchaeota archaeon]|nr:DNA-directed RNA polymerase subunit H [Euryarchaeota archaeon]